MLSPAQTFVNGLVHERKVESFVLSILVKTGVHFTVWINLMLCVRIKPIHYHVYTKLMLWPRKLSSALYFGDCRSNLVSAFGPFNFDDIFNTLI